MNTGRQPAVQRALDVILGWGLVETAPAVAPLEGAQWSALVDTLRQERLLGLAEAAVRSETLLVTPEQRLQVDSLHRQWMLAALQIEAELLEVVEHLSGNGVSTRILKGPAVAHLDYEDPALRCFSDVDLLIPGEQLGRAVEVLGELSLLRDLPERARGFDKRFGKEITLAGAGRVEVDLHRTLVLGPFGFTIDLGQLWAGEDPLPLGGRSLPALDRPRRFIHASLAAVCSDPQPALRTLRDVGQMAAGGLDVDAVESLARAWRVEAVVARAIRLAESAIQLSFPRRVSSLGDRPGDAWQRRCLRVYETAGGSNTTTLLGGTLGLPWRQRPAYLRMMIAPSHVYVQARRSAGRPAEWRTGLREILGLGRAGGEHVAR